MNGLFVLGVAPKEDSSCAVREPVSPSTVAGAAGPDARGGEYMRGAAGGSPMGPATAYSP